MTQTEMALFHLLAALSLLASTSAQQFVCTVPDQPSPGAPPLPNLPNQFSTRVEANIENRGYTVNVQEFYDKPNDRGRMDFTGGRFGGRTVISTFAEQQSFIINNTDNTCTARSITPDHNRLFAPVFDSQGNPHIRSVADFFQFGKQFQEVYMGRNEVRGIAADHWRTCTNTTFGGNMSIDWYFASANWSAGSVGLPLRSVVEGNDPQFNRQNRSLNFSVWHSFKHSYEFTVFTIGQPDPILFQIPKGIFCDGSNTAKVLPKFPDSFSARIQTFSVGGSITHQLEYFNSLTQSAYFEGSSNTYGHYKSFQNLNLGLIYIFNGSTCSVNNVSSLTLTQFPGERNIAVQSDSNPSQLRLRSIQDIWGFSRKNNVTYVGTRTVNDVLCDVWQEERSDFGNASIYEVSFSKPSLSYKLSQKTMSETQVPIRVEFYSKSLIGKPLTQRKPWEYHAYSNLYEYDMFPEVPAMNLLSCFNKFTTFWFQVKGMYGNVAGNLNKFIGSATSSVASSAKVHISRVSNIRVLQNKDNGNILIEGTILDKPNVPTYADTGVPLDVALDNLNKVIDSPQGLKILSYPAVSKSFTTKLSSSTSTSTSTGVSAGVVAGVAVAMLVVGGLLGAVILYFVMKRRGSFQVEYKTQVD